MSPNVVRSEHVLGPAGCEAEEEVALDSAADDDNEADDQTEHSAARATLGDTP